MFFTRAGNSLFDFRANRLFFVKKWAHERFTQKNEQFLTVAHLIWAKWANEQMSDEQMSELPALFFTT